MSFNGKTFNFHINEIKSKCGYDNLRFSHILLSYIVNVLKVERKEINDSLDLFYSDVNNE